MTTQFAPILVAHRGYPAIYPENSLLGISAALELGAKAIEFDIQFTADQVPVLFHDESLQRVTNEPGLIYNTQLSALQQASAGERERLGPTYENTRICSLIDIIPLLAKFPDSEIFVELKRHSLEHFGIKNTVDKVIQTLGPIKSQCYIISYNEEALSFAKKFYQYRTGWVIKKYDKTSFAIAQNINADILICNHEKIPRDCKQLEAGPWSWMIYETTDIKVVEYWKQRNAKYVETNAIGDLLE